MYNSLKQQASRLCEQVEIKHELVIKANMKRA